MANRIKGPIRFVGTRGRTWYGYEAAILADLCEAVPSAGQAGALRRTQYHIAARCEILVRGFARVGIVALVDEATGYQQDRQREELRATLGKYVSKELARWERAFEADFYRHLYRLKGWTSDPASTNRTHQAARLTVDLIYDRIHPDLPQELEHAREEKGKPNQKLHQWPTSFPGGGHPRLKQHNEGATALLGVARAWGQFAGWVDTRYPKLNQTMRAPFPADPEDEPPADWPFVFPRRAAAAFLALAVRSALVIAAARAFPPLSPPFRPRAAAPGSFPSGGGTGFSTSVSPVTASTMEVAVGFGSGSRCLRERSGVS